VPDTIGKYRIIKEVGEGSTGTVFLSHDPYYGRDVAIKLYSNATSEEDANARTTRKMFFTEAQMVGRLQHPNILPMFDAGIEKGRYYVVMEHVHNARTLATYCRPGNLLRQEDVTRIVFKCARALHYAHSRGVIHRDIKPSNIILTHDNDVRVIDFGIALCADSEISRIEGIAGSPSYMSPEQIKAEEITPAADLYSLGVVMYELVTGARPFKARSLDRLLHKIVYATPRPIHALREDVSEEFEEAVMKALRKNPAERYATGLEFAAELTRVHQSLQQQESVIDERERFDLLRGLPFFHEFSHSEIWEVLRASDWSEYRPGQEIVKEGELDDRFYVIVSGRVGVEVGGREVGRLAPGECFGETSYVPEAKRTATIRASDSVTLMRVSATLLETASASCQLRFNKVFLRSLIRRLQGTARSART
jgi:serine/threonine protein kinase